MPRYFSIGFIDFILKVQIFFDYTNLFSSKEYKDYTNFFSPKEHKKNDKIILNI